MARRRRILAALLLAVRRTVVRDGVIQPFERGDDLAPDLYGTPRQLPPVHFWTSLEVQIRATWFRIPSSSDGTPSRQKN